jgi:starch phosphorylase
VPTFYERGGDDLPRGWIGRMKASIASVCPYFNTHRMVQEYATRAYVPAAERYQQLLANEAATARDLAAWKRRLQEGWRDVRVLDVEAGDTSDLRAGAEVPVRARLALGVARPEDLRVELYAGPVDQRGQIAEGESAPMVPEDGFADGEAWFKGSLRLLSSGRRGFTVRVLPAHPGLAPRPEPGLIRWAQ